MKDILKIYEPSQASRKYDQTIILVGCNMKSKVFKYNSFFHMYFKCFGYGDTSLKAMARIFFRQISSLVTNTNTRMLNFDIAI